MIEIKQVSKHYKTYRKDPGFMGSLKSLWARNFITKTALKDIDLKISSGERIGLLGANGAGKTTLIKILAGIMPADEGTVSVMGYTPYEREASYLKQLAIVMGQKAQLWWDLPALDSFELLAAIYEQDRSLWMPRLDELSQKLNVAHLLKIPVRKLSLGERMKMELIGAFLHQPAIIFLDEPTLGLDLQAQKSVRQFILDYHEQYRPTIILTSHYMKDIEALCPRLVMIEQGKIIYDGSSDKISEANSQEKKLQITFKNPEEGQDFVIKMRNQFSLENADKSESSGSSPLVKHWNVPKKRLTEVMTFIMQETSMEDFNLSDMELSELIEQVWFTKKN
ncbi:MAG: ATP-binding cassette domain-containing protein [Bacteriovoracaceae bacterium]|nr:ATP-binding cassette domain-containing protein [Bacteriovoracaceae bacterium]